MRALLDTHIAVWWIAGDERLSLAARELIAEPENEIAVSIASFWEIAIKNGLERGAKSAFGVSVSASFDAFPAGDFAVLNIARRHLTELETLPRLHGDPFDRMLVIQAKVDGYRLITHDRMLGMYGETVLLV